MLSASDTTAAVVRHENKIVRHENKPMGGFSYFCHKKSK